jgi:hypothetical protein
MLPPFSASVFALAPVVAVSASPAAARGFRPTAPPNERGGFAGDDAIREPRHCRDDNDGGRGGRRQRARTPSLSEDATVIFVFFLPLFRSLSSRLMTSATVLATAAVGFFVS